MNFKDIFTAPAIAAVYNEAASNRIPYLGEGFFPAKQKAGLDLKWLIQNKGLPITLAPSAFDTVAPIRSREGFEVIDTEMAYFKEAMLIKEQDIQDYETMAEDSPKAREILDRIFDDSANLVQSAHVVAERMRMQLLANANGHPSISLADANGATYTYNFDPNSKYSTNNFTALSGTSLWSDTTNSDPLKDVSDAQDSVEQATGTRPSIMLISKATMNLLKANARIKGAILAQNVTANILMTDARVKELFSTELGINIIVYTKQFKDWDATAGAYVASKFYPDGMVTLLPEGALGNTWFGITPEQHRADKLDVAIVDTGIAVTKVVKEDPVQTLTKVSEVLLPSFERMYETYMIKVDTVAY